MFNFIRRNSPVFMIGFATLALFLGLILLAQKNSINGPTLEKVSEDELIAGHTNTRGAREAKVVLVEFSDFQCPACKQIQPYVKQIADRFPNDIILAFRHFPLPQHPEARQAAIASQIAGQEGKFWEYAEKLFDNQDSLQKNNLITYAAELGIDTVTFEQNLNDEIFKKQVEDDLSFGIRIGINSTPTFFLNNKILEYSNIENFRKQIIEEVKKVNPAAVSDAEESSGSFAEIFPEDRVVETTASTEAEYARILFDQKYGTIEIEYTEDGFIPSNIKAVQNQLVRWKNKTNKEIKIEQLINLYSEFKQPVAIQPGETFELRMTVEKLWNFKEKTHRHYGSIFVVQP
jgi:protein-disulfide isomerase